MPEALQIAANCVNAKILGAARETSLFLLNLLAFQVETGPATRGKATGWDGRASLFDFASGVFPAGFVHMVGRELKRRGHAVQFAVKPLPAPLGPQPGTIDPMGLGFTERYAYQPETVRRLLRHGRGIARVATGGGKSRIAILTYDAIRRTTLFMTTRTALMDQMKDAFEAMGVNPGVIGDGIWEPRRQMNVAMVQTLIARLRKPDPKDPPEKQAAQRQARERTIAFLSYVELVIGEEAHEVGGDGYYELMNLLRNASYRLALTATPFMRADDEANMRLQGAFGSILIEVSEEELINKNILATPYFRFLQAPAPPLLRRSTRWPGCHDMGIVRNAGRNAAVVAEVKRAAAHRLSSMVLIGRQEHGEILEALMLEAGLRAKFLWGTHKQAERKAVLATLRCGALDVVIGTSIFDVGVDIPALGLVVTAGGGKAEVNHRQRIGRGLREKKTGPNIAFFVDFEDGANRILHEHSLTRRAIIEATPGFRERLLAEGRDFPYELIAANNKQGASKRGQAA